jgi:hypothetical protein
MFLVRKMIARQRYNHDKKETGGDAGDAIVVKDAFVPIAGPINPMRLIWNDT